MSDELEVDSLSPAITALKAKIAKLQSAVDALEEVRASMGFVGATNGETSEVTFARDAFFGMTVADASRKFLSTTKRTSSAKTIAEALISGG